MARGAPDEAIVGGAGVGDGSDDVLRLFLLLALAADMAASVGEEGWIAAWEAMPRAEEKNELVKREVGKLR